MAQMIFKGFKNVNSDFSSFENGYIYFVRTNEEGTEGYIYFNGKIYGSGGGGGSSVTKDTVKNWGFVEDIDLNEVAYSGDYSDLFNTPAVVNDTTVSGWGYIKKACNDLENYYLKSETYTSSQVDDLIAAVSQFDAITASTLPTASESTKKKIYLIPATTPAGGNMMEEYITIENEGTYSWEKIGSTDIDLTGYATEQWVENQGYLTEHQDISGKQDVISDLPAIRSGAALGETSVQPSDISDMATKTWTTQQNYISAASTTVSSISSLPTSYRAILANISASATLSYSALPAEGFETHTIIHNTGSSSISVTLPSTGNYVCTINNVIYIAAGAYGEVNIITIGGKGYVRGIDSI